MFLILLANMLHDIAKERKRLDRRKNLLKQWVNDQSTPPSIKYREIGASLQKPELIFTMLSKEVEGVQVSGGAGRAVSGEPSRCASEVTGGSRSRSPIRFLPDRIG